MEKEDEGRGCTYIKKRGNRERERERERERGWEIERGDRERKWERERGQREREREREMVNKQFRPKSLKSNYWSGYTHTFKHTRV